MLYLLQVFNVVFDAEHQNGPLEPIVQIRYFILQLLLLVYISFTTWATISLSLSVLLLLQLKKVIPNLDEVVPHCVVHHDAPKLHYHFINQRARNIPYRVIVDVFPCQSMSNSNAIEPGTSTMLAFSL